MSRNSFDPHSYLVEIGRQLVRDFQDAGFATTPTTKGSAREVPVREMLESILPRGLAVGTGCVIDSFGSVSNQIDVVIYEKEFCPVFRINNDPNVTFFPCEGVVAVGEIKSLLSTKELIDIFAKVASVKKLQRFAGPPVGDDIPGLDDVVLFREYNSRTSFQGAKPEEYNQDSNPLDQIHGFALAGSLKLSPKTLCDKFVELSKQTGLHLSPNTIVTLDGNVLCPLCLLEEEPRLRIMPSPQDADGIYFVENQTNSFQFLLSRIYSIYQDGRTVKMSAFNRYVMKDGITRLPGNGRFEPFQTPFKRVSGLFKRVIGLL